MVAQVRNKMAESDVIKSIQEGKPPVSGCKPYRLAEDTAKIYEALRSGEDMISIAKVGLLCQSNRMYVCVCCYY